MYAYEIKNIKKETVYKKFHLARQQELRQHSPERINTTCT